MEGRSATWNLESPAGRNGAADHTLDVLEAVIAEAPEASLATISARAGLPKPTVHRLLAVFLRRGYAVATAYGRYAPGPQLLAAAGQVSDSLDYPRAVRPALWALQKQTNETIHFALLSGTEAVYIDKLESGGPYRMASMVGMRLSLHCTAIGKAILAHMARQERDSLLAELDLTPRTPRTLTSRRSLEAEFAKIVDCGYAMDNEENDEGVRCIGAPVFDHRGAGIGATSVSAPAITFSEAQAVAVAPALMAATARISQALGAPAHVATLPVMRPVDA